MVVLKRKGPARGARPLRRSSAYRPGSVSLQSLLHCRLNRQANHRGRDVRGLFHGRRDPYPCSVRTHGLEARSKRAAEAAVHAFHAGPIHLRSSASRALHEPSAQGAMLLRNTEDAPSSPCATRSGRRMAPNIRSSTHSRLRA